MGNHIPGQVADLVTMSEDEITIEYIEVVRKMQIGLTEQEDYLSALVGAKTTSL